mgnify:CR=1 FL=1
MEDQSVFISKKADQDPQGTCQYPDDKRTDYFPFPEEEWYQKAYDKADAKLQNFRHFLWKEPFLESFNDVGLNDNSRHFSSMVK